MAKKTMIIDIPSTIPELDATNPRITKKGKMSKMRKFDLTYINLDANFKVRIKIQMGQRCTPDAAPNRYAEDSPGVKSPSNVRDAKRQSNTSFKLRCLIFL
jgi:hypothetical protein